MITIGQLARYVGVSTKTIRFYHQKGLLAEPARDASGYRRYTAQQVVELIKVRTLAEAGLPLADIREVTAEDDSDLATHIQRADRDLSDRIRRLRATQRRLRQLAAGTLQLLPGDVTAHLEQLPGMGFSPRWVRLETDLWILVFATHPGTAADLFRDQAQALTDSALRQLYLDYDEAHDLDPDDPLIDDLAHRIVEASKARYRADGPPGQDVDSDVPALAQGAVNAFSPAWRRLDHLIRSQLPL
ncbi:MerR family transcriptional regulator [Auraticoccus monumenti]|uniref:DNA-binding transcriptional regulator, MerR family n=1 Tax=Auraticoccus monumenti TaxID=675864 RepID=A0A1G6Z8W3_9ACTN|nr:MerR family transcriptional regulator [Auraticoccus monumenti]SDD98733.1 DNA-binding transcriptional regulator, MerR family [Auraticoccus monumenti]